MSRFVLLVFIKSSPPRFLVLQGNTHNQSKAFQRLIERCKWDGLVENAAQVHISGLSYRSHTYFIYFQSAVFSLTGFEHWYFHKKCILIMTVLLCDKRVQMLRRSLLLFVSDLLGKPKKMKTSWRWMVLWLIGRSAAAVNLFIHKRLAARCSS